MRRIVENPRSTHFSEVNVSPQWHQWLRHTRKEAPSLQEQSADVRRLQNLKVLAAEADKRWAAKKSLLDQPEGRIAQLGISGAGSLKREEGRGTWNPEGAEEKIGETQGSQDAERIPRFREGRDERRKERKEAVDPWKQARGGPSEEWQPQAASIAPAKR